MAYEGFVDVADGGEIRGWAYDNTVPNDPVSVEILAYDRVVATVRADQFRPDLAALGKGNGAHGFAYRFAPAPGPTPLAARIRGKRWLMQFSGRPAIALRTAAHFSHSLEYGFPALEGTFSKAVASEDEEQIVERLVNAYHRASEDNTESGKKSDVWSELGNLFHREIVELLQRRDIKGACNYLREVHGKGLTHGISQGEATTQLLKERGDVRQRLVSQYVDQLTSLAEFFGLLNVECPEQLGEWGQNFHQDPQALVDEIGKRIGFPLVPPRVIGSLFGINTSAGVLCSRDLMALYAALRLQAVADDRGIKEPSICEIGGGLGGVAYYANRLGIGRYTIIDLPLINVLQGYFLLRALPGTNICLYGEQDSGAAIYLMPTWRFHQAEPRYDILFNQDSMPEMHTEYSLGYLRQARQNIRHAFLSINQEAQAPQSPTAKQAVVRKLVEEAGGFERAYRFRHWLRPGYVEELFKISSGAAS